MTKVKRKRGGFRVAGRQLFLCLLAQTRQDPTLARTNIQTHYRLTITKGNEHDDALALGLTDTNTHTDKHVEEGEGASRARVRPHDLT